MTASTEMERDSVSLLKALAEYTPPIHENPDDDPERGHHMLNDTELTQITGLTHNRALDAASFLQINGYAELYQFLGGNFDVALTSLGRHQYQRLANVDPRPDEPTQASRVEPQLPIQPTPVGSPFGFTDLDWEFIESERRRPYIVKVVFGYQFESNHYNSEKIQLAVKSHFDEAIETYNNQAGRRSIAVDFKPLQAGLGEHLFNQIARDIISADIAVFETSDLNPNVMIEMGVALTWGVRVLPIKAEGQPSPPSDISGQTWVDYRDDGRTFVDPQIKPGLVSMIARAIQKKPSA